MITTLSGRYEVGEEIGRGGMAVVRRGRDIRLGRDIAIKVLRTDLAADPAFLTRFRREAQAAAGLDAPHIVAVYDTGVGDEGVPWIAMELVDGRTLRDVLHTEGRLLPQRALEVTADVCSALEVAHGAGIIHRDIKPGNVMLTGQGDVKVMDFGIARAAAMSSHTATETSAVIGTAAYLSPEQARGEHVDARSDLYSTGCLLYELLTGVPPFVGDSAVAVAYQHVREDPVQPSAYDPSLGGDVDAVVLKALAKNPANRYQDAAEMRADLLRAATGEPVLATPLLAVEEPPPVRPSRTRRRIFWSVVALVLAAVAVGTAVLVRTVLGPGSDLFTPPDVRGLAQAEALQELSQADLDVDKVTPVFDRSPAGTVIRQVPDANFLVHHGDTVDLFVSKGLETGVVPQLVGLDQAEATQDLATVKLKAAIASKDVNAPAGTVLTASTAPGTVVGVGTVIKLVVASGNVPVPDVRGLDQNAAVAQLGAAGFAIGLEAVLSAQAPGTVVDQTPVGTVAPQGSSIILMVAGEQTPPSPSPSPSASPAPSPSPTA